MKIPLKALLIELQDIREYFKWTETSLSGNLKRIEGLNNLRLIYPKLEALTLFSFSDHFKTSVIKNQADLIDLQIGLADSLTTELESISNRIMLILEILSMIIPEEEENSINIKLSKVNDFDELSKISKDIHLALTQVILNDEIKGNTRITSVTNGSIWLNVLIGVNAMPVVAALTWASAVIYKKIQEGKIVHE